MTHSTIEIERKYDVDESATPPRLVGAGPVALESAPETVELRATYFDTADLILAHHAIALRRRLGGSDAGWHLKTPADEGRTEYHWPLDEQDSTPPASVLDAVRGYTAGAPLIPIARVTNTRTTVLLEDAAGFAIAELCDDHVHSENLLDGSTHSWREWEVELLSAAPDTRKARTALLEDIEHRVVQAGAHASASSSKLARALGVDTLGT